MNKHQYNVDTNRKGNVSIWGLNRMRCCPEWIMFFY